MNLRLVDEEKALSYQSYEIDTTDFDVAIPATLLSAKVTIEDTAAYEAWKQSNVIVQKQAGYLAIGIKVLLGDFTDKAELWN
jgi:sulfite reductase (ferredoxin)